MKGHLYHVLFEYTCTLIAVLVASLKKKSGYFLRYCNNHCFDNQFYRIVLNTCVLVGDSSYMSIIS